MHVWSRESSNAADEIMSSDYSDISDDEKDVLRSQLFMAEQLFQNNSEGNIIDSDDSDDDDEEVLSFSVKKRILEHLLSKFPETILEDDFDEDNCNNSNRTKRRRKTSPRPDYWNSVWGQML